MSGNHEAVVRNPLILGDKTYHQMTEDICRPIEGKANKYWWISFVIAFTAMMLGNHLFGLYNRYRYRCLGSQ